MICQSTSLVDSTYSTHDHKYSQSKRPATLQKRHQQIVKQKMRMKAMRLDTKKQISKAALVIFRVWARPRHWANPTVQIKLSLKKNDQGENLSHSKFGRKTEKETHKQRYNLVQKSQAEIQMWKKFYHLCESSVTLCWTCSLQIKVNLKQREMMQKSINEEGMVLRSHVVALWKQRICSAIFVVNPSWPTHLHRL